jgi:hypothetical protein
MLVGFEAMIRAHGVGGKYVVSFLDLFGVSIVG